VPPGGLPARGPPPTLPLASSLPAAGWLCRHHPPSPPTMIREENMKKNVGANNVGFTFFAYKYWFKNGKKRRRKYEQNIGANNVGFTFLHINIG
jgi:hypothetical protein